MPYTNKVAEKEIDQIVKTLDDGTVLLEFTNVPRFMKRDRATLVFSPGYYYEMPDHSVRYCYDEMHLIKFQNITPNPVVKYMPTASWWYSNLLDNTIIFDPTIPTFPSIIIVDDEYEYDHLLED